VPTVVRARTVAAPQDEVWRLVSDPWSLPRWWPGLERVEDVSDGAWTQVFRSSRGRAVRGDFTVVSRDEPQRIVWRQELLATPFERFMREDVTGVLLSRDAVGTRLELRSVRRFRGFARFGGFMARRAARRQLDEALESVATALEPSPS
jgi:uncharacterized protein YndB with AHSA1/START domain